MPRKIYTLPTEPERYQPLTIEEIRELCERRGWTQKILAERLGLCKNTVERWFSSKEDKRLTPSVAEMLVMRAWLTEARATAPQYDEVSA